ncbi:MAG: SDR family NAD(P)-dependent oxidoreductase [Micromonosporaceae bacterium]|nr:SDR family NAD(P)-dependent oxidoreductase [Micromonosporaceae bacterium]
MELGRLGQDVGVRRALRILAGIAGPGPSESALRRAVAGRVIVVTGASEGIGAATAVRLAAAGARVVLVARTAARLAEVRQRIVAAGGTAITHPCDLSDPAAAGALAAELLETYGRVDVVVSNAGHSINRSVAATADRFHDIARTAGINYLGPVALLLGLLPAMRAAGCGHIVNVSTASLAGFPPGWSAYLASKGAFDIWLRSAAPELRRDGVTVSTIYFGMVRTRMSAPTLARWPVPAATAEEAAAMVCRAIARRPRTIWPWWARLGQPLAVAFPSLLERCYAGFLAAAQSLTVPRALHRAGLLRPRVLVRAARAAWRYGGTLAAAVAAGPGTGVALVDRHGPLSTQALREQAEDWVASLAPLVDIGRVGLACGPGREFVLAVVALGRLGVDTVLVSPDTPPGRLPELLAAHDLRVIVHDGRYDAVTGRFGHPDDGMVPGWRLPVDADRGPVVPATVSDRPRRPGRLTVLTSGSTGIPKAVTRTLPVRTLLGTVATHLQLLPLRPGRPFVLAAPPHHGFGLSYLAAGLAIGAPVVLAAGLDAAAILDLAAEYDAELLVALPVQLYRIVAEQRRRSTPSGLRAIVSGAAPLSAELYAELVQEFGNIVFNLYGTTEAGWSAIATPADLAAAPGTVGRAPHGVRLRIRDAEGRLLPPGTVGQVYVSGWLPGGREVATGDLGRLDALGRLYLHGRLDTMIVSGGVNVYPEVVAAALAEHPEVAEVRVTPVDDPEYGQRLSVIVRPRPGAELTADGLRAWQRTHLPPAQRARDITVVDRLDQ